MKLLFDTNVILDMAFKRNDCGISMKLLKKAFLYDLQGDS